MDTILFMVSDGYGWGLGVSLTEAMGNYTKFNHHMKRGGKYELRIWKTPNADNITINDMQVHWTKDDTLLYKGVETK